MNVCFVNTHEYPHLNLGLSYLIASTLKHGHRISLIDTTFVHQDKKAYILDKVRRDKPEVICFSTCISNQGFTMCVAEEIKRQYPEIWVLWGGPHPTISPESLSSSSTDAICIGEGEWPLVRFLEMLEDGKIKQIPGIILNRGASDPRSLKKVALNNLDNLPFPHLDLWDLKSYLQVEGPLPGALRMTASRGCPYNCTFCSTKILATANSGHFYRTRSPENVVAEVLRDVERYRKKGFRSVTFADLTFGACIKQLREFTSKYREAGLHEKIPWSCQTTASLVTKEWARRVSEAGCLVVSMGIETGNQNRRVRIYNKPVSNQHVRTAVRNLRKYGIAVEFYLIVGAPGETRSDLIETLRFTYKLAPDTTCISAYIPLNGTDILKYQEEMKGSAVYSKGIPIGLDQPSLRYKDLRRMFLILHGIIGVNNFIRGLQVSKHHFLFDSLAYILNIKGCRPIPMMSSPNAVLMPRRAIHKTYYRRWKKRAPPP